MKTKKCGIYKITNKVNGKIYIGQARDMEKRWKKHIYNSGYVYMNNHLYSAIRKYGIDNFVFSIICEVPENALDEYEISYIKYYETTNRAKGYNLMSGGSNGRPTEDTKQKISEASKGKPSYERTEEHKKETSKLHKGKILSEETKTKISDSKKGKSLSDEHKKKIREGGKGKKRSDETKKKMSDSQKKQYQYQGIIYNGKQELADFLGILYKALESRIYRKQIDVTIIHKK